MTTQKLSVPDIHCGGCAASIEGAVRSLEGIETVKVELSDHTVDVSFDESTVRLDAIVEAIEGQGYLVAT